ncbi:unnamed protein product, partial [Hymenolepis diminuta]
KYLFLQENQNSKDSPILQLQNTPTQQIPNHKLGPIIFHMCKIIVIAHKSKDLETFGAARQILRLARDALHQNLLATQVKIN